MRSVLNKIIDLGSSNGTWSDLLKNKYRLTNSIALSLTVSTFPFIFIFNASSSVLSFATLGFMLLFASCIVLNAKGWLNLSRNLLLFSWGGGVFVYSLFLGKEAGLQFCYFSLVATPFIMFTPEESNQKIIHVFISLFFYALIDFELISPSFEKIISVESALFISGFVKPVVVVQIAILLYYYSAKEADLLKEIKSNEKLNFSLKANSEELIKFSSKLKRNETSLNSLLNSIDDVVLEVNSKGEVLNCWTSSEEKVKIGSNVGDSFGNCMKIKVIGAFSQFKGDYFNKIHEYLYNGKNYQFKITPVNHTDSNEETAVVAIRDITINRKLSEEYNEIKKEKELTERSAEFKESFLANVSHEIRTPLNGVVGMIDLLEGTKIDEVQRDYIDTLKSSSNSLLVLINDVLDLSKIQAGKMDIILKDGDIHLLLKNALDLYRPMAEGKGLQLNLAINEDVPQYLSYDPTRLNQVITNLLSNAVKFTKEGQVSLGVTKTNEGLKFIIEDTGEGIPLSAQKSIFQKFTQIENESTHIKGTGLGLSIVANLVQLMGGEIKVKSEPNKGTMFYFSLALKKVDSPIFKEDQSKVAKDWKGKKILLVDDISVNRKVAGIMLKKSGAEVVEAVNGLEATKLVNDFDFDLILMDIQMPIMGGEEAMLKIKAEGFSKPIIALSANALEGDEEKYIEKGFNGYISKPITLAKLQSGLNKFHTV